MTGEGRATADELPRGSAAKSDRRSRATSRWLLLPPLTPPVEEGGGDSRCSAWGEKAPSSFLMAAVTGFSCAGGAYDFWTGRAGGR